MSKKLLAYVSGPIRDSRGPWYVEQNVRIAEAVAVELWRMGFAVICPHTNTRGFDGIGLSHDDFVAGDLVILERCDLIVMVPGYERSKGSIQEVTHARSVGVPVFYFDSDLWCLREFVRRRQGKVRLLSRAEQLTFDFVTKDLARRGQGWGPLRRGHNP